MTVRDRRWRAWLLAGCLLAVAPSRLLFIPGVPWEQDEALFAAAAFDTDLAQRRPHPPGFPLWVAASKISLALLGEPEVGLQLLSALASIAMVPLLARLWAAWIGAPLGSAAAILYAFLPGVLFHAPRAFTTTPSMTLACLAGAIWLGPGRQRLLLGSAALAGAVLVRPLLAPPMAVLWAVAMILRKERVSSAAASAVVTGSLTVVGFVPLIVDSGGLRDFLDAVTSHGVEQWTALPTAVWSVADLGVVRSLGGWPACALFLALAAVGVTASARRDPRLTSVWAVVFATTTAWILGAHNPTLPRYSLPLLALLSGHAVVGAATVVRCQTRAAWVAAAVAAASLLWTLPALRTQATEPFPPLEALGRAQVVPSVDAVVVDGGLSPFSDLVALANRSPRPVFWRPLLANGRVPPDRIRGRWVHVSASGTESGLVPGPPLGTTEIACLSARLRGLSQRRYLTAWVAERGGIVLHPAAPVSADGAAPVRPRLVLLLQPVPSGSWLGTVLHVTGSPATLALSLDGEVIRSGTLAAGEHVVHVPVGARPSEREARPARAVLRQLGAAEATVSLRRIWVDPPSGRGAPTLLTPADLAAGMGGLVTSSGFHSPEVLGTPAAPGRWTERTASLFLPAGPGRLSVRLCAPRPDRARVQIDVPRLGWARSLEVSGEWVEITLPISEPVGRLRLNIEVLNPFVPARTVPGSSDRRELGVVVGSLALESAGAAPSG